MSYILDALRKSESERRQGRVPDLGQQVQLIHRPKKRSRIAAVWIGVGLMLNAAVLAYVFWPQTGSEAASANAATQTPAAAAVPDVPEIPVAPGAAPLAQEIPVPEPISAPLVQERPTIIVPSPAPIRPTQAYDTSQLTGGRVPHLIEMSPAFQQSIPDLVFNSHLFASEPSSRRVMINNSYLGVGDRFSGIRVEQITEEGVVLSKDGQSFRVGVVRNWVSPN